MALVKCEKGHFYDSEKFLSCPYCQIAPRTHEELMDETTQWTMGYEGMDDHTMGYEPLPDDEERTIGMVFSRTGSPVTGWLVCVEGPERGRDYRLHAGRNYVGRSLNSDVVVEDRDISRKNHFSVVYDAKHQAFLIAPGEGTLTYLDGQVLRGACPLTEEMRIQAGQSSFAFRSFCREGVQWDETV
ncbi:MAG: FHA domain-containing protein [Lachnospiraceae bacterium]|nr:FHA domain-containing protein [Lachnospiraceae bacterium]